MATHNDLGLRGEQLAIDYLEEIGYTILERNYRYLKAEIDIIAKKDDLLVVIEVKTRSSTYFGKPENFVNSKKIKLMVQAADHYVNKRDFDVNIRFDIIGIVYLETTYELDHIKDAFLYF